MLNYRFTPVTVADATEFCGWRYGPGYGLYDLGVADLAPMLHPDRNYYSVRLDATLIGLACYGEDARICGGPYDPGPLDFGCCLAPALVGQGWGMAFVKAVVDFAETHFSPQTLRLSVEVGNARAIRVYAGLGFETRRRFAGMTHGGTHRFLLMTRAVSLSS